MTFYDIPEQTRLEREYRVVSDIFTELYDEERDGNNSIHPPVAIHNSMVDYMEAVGDQMSSCDSTLHQKLVLLKALEMSFELGNRLALKGFSTSAFLECNCSQIDDSEIEALLNNEK